MRATAAAAIAWSLALAPGVVAQTTPTKAELEQWKQPATQALELWPCRKVNWLLETEEKAGGKEIHDELGWWGRGFAEGAAYIADVNDKSRTLQKRVLEFGVSTDVVAAHIAAHCYAYPDDVTYNAMQAFLVKAMR